MVGLPVLAFSCPIEHALPKWVSVSVWKESR